MKVRELMSRPVIRIHADEPVTVAARTLAHYNIGALPVCGMDERLCGVITDRDIVTRCLAAEKDLNRTLVRDVMTSAVLSVEADADTALAAHMMGRRQVRRLPVLENGRLCGMLSLGDLASCEDGAYDAADVLAEIAGNVTNR